VPHLDLKEVKKGQRKRKKLKGDMVAMRGYGEDTYGGGDFNETRGRNLCSIAKNLAIRLVEGIRYHTI
jgi:hypothetical protein